ncbi:ABC transporter ATP-binding protein [Clostridium sp. D2Q-14]|uniref:ABC transporter ATP-binding protein n=1 Tax=Anaeromonas gelatinilytica TaxID=2683194 RepID=UPI00193BB315|nr:ABC transporter ATP-binding protein [Anaeromonas gelatinilytica]MBS4534340.1 ABC transporter ATP-binding protein [Anaeromonas gelatinilytica]
MIKLQGIWFSYGNENTGDELRNINLTIPEGQVVLICGESGCGKTTLTRLINGLIPNYYEGKLQGSVLIEDTNISEKPLYDIAPLVGSVFQNPRSQFFSMDTTSELAFGCENIGLSEDLITERMERVVSDFQISYLMGRSIFALSGGEKQKIACASSAMMEPKIFVLDEPSSNLDIKSIGDLAKVIALWKEQKKTIIITEHRLSYLMALADRVIYMKNGEIAEDLRIEEFKNIPQKEIYNMGLRSIAPITFQHHNDKILEKEMLELSNFHFSYEKIPTLEINHLKIPKRSIVGIIGNNGAGKTTFARCLCGLEKKSAGELQIGRKIFSGKQRLNQCYMVMQNPSHQLFTEEVMDEVLLSMEDDTEENRELVNKVLHDLNLQGLKNRHPMSFSGGQQQRVAIASAIVSGRSMMVFDEPTSGLDFRHMKEVARNLQKLGAMGNTLFIITHDPELIAECCNYFIFMEQGKVLWSGGWSDLNMQRIINFFEATQYMELIHR